MALWTPADLSTAPKIWLKADALALANNDPVTTWTDSSGNGANATKPSWATAPTFQTAQLNSLPIVRFLTSGPQALRASPSVTIPFTVFALARTTTPATSGRVISGCADTGQNWLMGWHGTHENVYYFSATGDLTGQASTTSWLQYSAHGDGGGTNTDFYRYGTLLRSALDAGGNLGGKLGLSGDAENTNTEITDCEVAEVVIVDFKAGTTDRQLVEGYLAWKWGQQTSLPASHPYFTFPPGDPSNRMNPRRINPNNMGFGR